MSQLLAESESEMAQPLADAPPEPKFEADGSIRREGWVFGARAADAPFRRHPECVDALTAHFNLVAREARYGRWRFQTTDTFKADDYYFTAKYSEERDENDSHVVLKVMSLVVATEREIKARAT